MLPVPAFDHLIYALGINRTMDHFTGRAAEVSGLPGPKYDGGT
jgi:hypothetical protein